MKLWLPILVLLVTSAFGVLWRRNQGKIKLKSSNNILLTEKELGIPLGNRVTILQFSSGFCSPCRATAQIISGLVRDMPDVIYTQIKSEENISLVENFDIKSTPTVIFFNSQGLEVGRAVGVPSNQQLLATIANIH